LLRIQVSRPQPIQQFVVAPDPDQVGRLPKLLAAQVVKDPPNRVLNGSIRLGPLARFVRLGYHTATSVTLGGTAGRDNQQGFGIGTCRIRDPLAASDRPRAN
jgi:hypothetical protein